MKSLLSIITCILACVAFGAGEKPVNFIPATPNEPVVGDYAGEGSLVAQVINLEKGGYQAILRNSFDSPDKPVAVLKADAAKDNITFAGDGWSGKVASSHSTAAKGDQHCDLARTERKPPTLGAAPPSGAIVLFDGKNLD